MFRFCAVECRIHARRERRDSLLNSGSVRTVDRSTAASKDWPFTSGRSSDERTIRLTALSSPQRPTVLLFTLMMTRTSSRWSKPMRATSCRLHGFGDKTPTEWINCCRKSRTPPMEN